ncbi:MAG: Phosphomannomutase [Candidatus Methanofastidiosum methylothiophilum]|uniref:Phosphomannomutase n=1 Tax=Candidatus Methanofastidiosum methylothiophilum TaxID=1705564 RepID=A0A150J8E5_9EURY|nr:MAG: Phosphomannomutase [Candidatus Methanofastidiosum methylthiophilus]
MSPFKAYDIRGVYPDEIDEQFAYNIGKTLGKKHEPIAVGIDSRIGSEKIRDYFIQGIIDEISDVCYLGLVSTPLLYFATKNRFSLGIMITASHNPRDYTGFKICDKNAIPLLPIEDIQCNFKKQSLPNEIRKIEDTGKDIIEEYSNLFIRKLAQFKNYNISADFSNGSTVVERKILEQVFPKINVINGIPDGNFPSHPPNALGQESTQQLRNLVKETQSDIGIIFDGDGDRIGIIDEKGNEVRGDILTAIIAREMLKSNKGKILYDLRSSSVVPEIISEYGGLPIKTRVGHPFIKKLMRKEDAIFAGEFSNHFYFKEIGGFESPLLALYYILSALNGRNLSEEVKDLTKYCHSGEINIDTDNPTESINKLIDEFITKKIEKIDGVTISENNWWVNIRPSNTEPLIRITAEAEDEKTLTELIETVKGVLLS